MRTRLILLLIGLIGYASLGYAQEERTEETRVAIERDSVGIAVPDSTTRAVLAAADSAGVPDVKMELAFKPNPTRAVLYALVPGLGQIYNRKYWKLPIVYGGLMGCMYAITWNNKNYQDYSEAYRDIIFDQKNKAGELAYELAGADLARPELVDQRLEFQRAAEKQEGLLPPVPRLEHHHRGGRVRAEHHRRVRGRPVVRFRHIAGFIHARRAGRNAQDERDARHVRGELEFEVLIQ